MDYLLFCAWNSIQINISAAISVIFFEKLFRFAPLTIKMRDCLTGDSTLGRDGMLTTNRKHPSLRDY